MSSPDDCLLGDVELVTESGVRQLEGEPLHFTASAPPWSHLVRFRLRAGVLTASAGGERLAIRVTVQVLSGRLGALCISTDTETAIGGSVEWRTADGVLTLDVPIYAFPGDGWLVFRTTGYEAEEELAFRILDVHPVTGEASPAPKHDVAPVQRAVIYTAVTNGYDTIRAPQSIEPDCEYVCFTDDPSLAAPQPWQTRPIDREGRDPRMIAKWYKVHPHLLFPEHDVSVWVDGRVRLTGGAMPLVREVLSHADFGVFENPWVDCVYLQAEEAIEKGRDVATLVERQMKRYARAGFPRHAFSVCGGFIVRRHHERPVVRAMKAWWHEMDKGSVRDQLSLGYLLWKQGLEFQPIRRLIFDNSYLELGKHNFSDRLVS